MYRSLLEAEDEHALQALAACFPCFLPLCGPVHPQHNDEQAPLNLVEGLRQADLSRNADITSKIWQLTPPPPHCKANTILPSRENIYAFVEAVRVANTVSPNQGGWIQRALHAQAQCYDELDPALGLNVHFQGLAEIASLKALEDGGNQLQVPPLATPAAPMSGQAAPSGHRATFWNAADPSSLESFLQSSKPAQTQVETQPRTSNNRRAIAQRAQRHAADEESWDEGVISLSSDESSADSASEEED